MVARSGRPNRSRGCERKRSYPTREAANKARRALIGRGANRLEVYGTPGLPGSDIPCRWCGGWHLGHKQERRR